MNLLRPAALLAAALAHSLPAPQLTAQTGTAGASGATFEFSNEAMSRDSAGHATISVAPVPGRITIDGRLDEDWYQNSQPITGFLQSLPEDGAPATEETEAWLGYDAENIYVSAKLWDSAPESQWVANEMRRDTNQLRNNDTFGIGFDTFADRRNGVFFYVNPLGAVADFQITNEGNGNFDWNPIWTVRTGRFEGGWTVEAAIPFKSLRYEAGSEQSWGIQLRRVIRRRNEWTYASYLPRGLSGNGPPGTFRVSRWGTLEGLETPPPSRNLEVKPYAISGLRTERTGAANLLSDNYYADAGLDVKYGVTENLTLDLTLNTDFAQVEVDEQQVNLTRFNIQFPEKREFFLEGRGIFDFASSGIGASAGGGNAPRLFFSRRIGLQGSDPVPILGGARLTGKVGAFDVGLLNVQTQEHDEAGVPATNFAVVRLRRDILDRSSIGMLFGGRSESTVSEGSNQTFGVDASLAFFENVNVLTWYARTDTRDAVGQEDSYQGRVSYDHDTYGLVFDHLLVGDAFNPEVGFLRRDNFRQSFASARYSPRPASIESIRQVTFESQINYIESLTGGFVEEREMQGQFQIEFENSDSFSLVGGNTYENLILPFRIAPGITVPAGRYTYRDVRASFGLGLQRPYSGAVSAQYGSFYDGDRTSVSFQRGRVAVLPQLSVEPSISFNWVDLPQGSFSSHLASTRINYSFTPRTFLSGLVQYNTSNDTFSSNIRLRWEYAPGSELFVVYTDDRDMDVLDRFSELSNRGLVIKVNRLLRP